MSEKKRREKRREGEHPEKRMEIVITQSKKT